MLSFLALVALASSLTPAVLAQSPVYGQCGGQNWSGATTCASGSACVYSNPYYSQCLPGASTTTTTKTTATPTTTSTTTKQTTTTTSTTTASQPTASGSASCPSGTKFQYLGVNESGAEFGNTAWPGVLGTDYTWPEPSSIDYFTSNGFNTFRVTFLMERISPPANGLTGAFDPTYLQGLQTIVNYITNKGAYAVIDPHNFMRYDNSIISSTSQFQTWWQNLAGQFKSNSHVIFDIQNEPNGIDASVVFQLNQAAINGIRASGATTQLILAEGTSWTGAWTWISSGNGAAFGAIRDPNNNTAIQMHQYLDSDGSGTNATCVSSTIGAERIQAATQWLQQNGLKGFLGEIGAGSDATCQAAVSGALCAMQESGVWLGALWWAAGPWWGTYYQSIEPPSGPAVAAIVPLLKGFQ
ncbi:glycoside hydrolase family 5 protein [Sphaerobolus stellatus SS14]|nr:glycoside hydrolase family 5 protein [Sphaerobolus stellatus SS14]